MEAALKQDIAEAAGSVDKSAVQVYCLGMPQALKIAVACVAIVSVAYVLISPVLDEMDGILRARHLVKTSATLVGASVGQPAVFSTLLRYFTATLALLHLDKPALSDLTCTRLC